MKYAHDTGRGGEADEKTLTRGDADGPQSAIAEAELPACERVARARRLLAAGVDLRDAAARCDLPLRLCRRLGVRAMVAALTARLSMNGALAVDAGRRC